MGAVDIGEGAVALIDDEDTPLVATRAWRLHPQGYVFSPGRPTRGTKTVYMHRLIIEAPPGLEVDHINRDKLDNRRANLRLASRSQNEMNKISPRGASGFRGVFSQCGRWRAVIGGRYVRQYLGTYDTREEAANAYDRAARGLYGEFAVLNNANTNTGDL